jgi:hypothetical protein
VRSNCGHTINRHFSRTILKLKLHYSREYLYSITSFNFLCIFKCPMLCPCVRHVQTAPNDHSFTFCCALFPLISTFLFTAIILSDKLYSDMNFTTNSGPESHLLMTKESMRICDNQKGTSVWCSLWNIIL